MIFTSSIKDRKYEMLYLHLYNCKCDQLDHETKRDQKMKKIENNAM